METSARLERYSRAQRCASFISREEVRQSLKLLFLEPEFRDYLKGVIYEILCNDLGEPQNSG